MDKKFWGFWGCLVAALGFCLFTVSLLSGCATRTKIVAGPFQVAGQAQVFEKSQGFGFETTPDGISLTVGYLETSVMGSFGRCEKIVGLEHSTGDPDKVFNNTD